jgi:membrane protein DedA with SNARE-associated domain
METIVGWVKEYGYAGIFSLLTLGIIGLPIPDEGLLAFAGYLVYKGDLHIVPTIGASFLGSASGITFSYCLGRTAGNYLVREYGHFVGITAQKVTQARSWFDRVGRWGLLFGYFLPGVRHLTALVAGKLSVFARFAYTGGFIWSVTFVVTGYYLGEEWTSVAEKIRPALVAVSGASIALICGYFFVQQRKHGRQ